MDLVQGSLRKPMRIYIAGPMTGYPGLNFDAFFAMEARLVELGHVVVNPARICPDPTMAWADCMRADIRELLTCDGLQLLPKWQASKGATLEHSIALALGMVILQPPFHEAHLECPGEYQQGQPVDCCRECQRPAGCAIKPEAVLTEAGFECGQRVFHANSVVRAPRVGQTAMLGGEAP